jgi:hypothetical protein
MLVLVRDDCPRQLDRGGLHMAPIANLIENAVGEAAHAGNASGIARIKKSDLAEQRIGWSAMRRTVDDANVVPEITHDIGKQARIGRNPGAVGERQVETVKIDAAHRGLSASPSRRCAHAGRVEERRKGGGGYHHARRLVEHEPAKPTFSDLLTKGVHSFLINQPEDQAVTNAERLRELAGWYRAFAERTANPAIWDARLRTAEDLEAEAARVERQDAEFADSESPG